MGGTREAGGALRSVALALLWVFAGTVLLLRGGWSGPVVVVAASAVTVLPFVVVWPEGLDLFRAPRWLVGAAVAAVVFAAAYLGLVEELGWRVLAGRLHAFAVGPAEEFVFRGFIWHQSERLASDPRVVIGLNVLAFTAVHLPRVAATGQPDLVSVAVMGLCLCLIRAWTGGLLVPASAHSVVNFLG